MFIALKLWVLHFIRYSVVHTNTTQTSQEIEQNGDTNKDFLDDVPKKLIW